MTDNKQQKTTATEQQPAPPINTTMGNMMNTNQVVDNMSPVPPPQSSSSPISDRRKSAEWDASKVPPSRFQKRKGSIYAVPSSRDGHIDSNYAARFHEKHAEKGYGKTR